MALKSVKADFGINGVNGKVFLGGATALNLLGGVSSKVSVPEKWEQKLTQFISCDDGGEFSLGEQTIIKTGFYVKAKGIKFTETEHGAKGPAYWEIAQNVANIAPTELAALTRKVLAAPTTSCTPWVATFIAALFLSEVVRNPRSFMVNLMLLDLIEGKVKYGRNEDKELNFTKLLKFESGKETTYTYEGGDVQVGGKDGKAGTVRGGKLPMSHLNAMDQYQTTTASKFEYQKKWGPYAKQSGLDLKAPSNAGVAYHFSNELLDKECTIVLRWLIAYFNKKPLRYVTGTEKAEVVVKGAWGKADSKQVMNRDVTVPVSLTALREHVRPADYVDAGQQKDAKTPAGFLSNSSERALSERLKGVACLL